MTEKITEGQQPEEIGEIQPEPKPKLTAGQLCKKIGWELLDLLKGAAFPFIVMCVFSTTIILFFEYDELAVQILAVVVGEGLLIAAFAMFGKQNGAVAYRCKCINDGKRKLGTNDIKIQWRIGEYAPWKGFVIGFITTLLFLIFQIIACFGSFTFVDFILGYACGWAIAPLDLFGDSIPPACYLLMIVFPIAIHGGFYIFGRHSEEKRQAKISRAEDDKRKGKKKHYYEENERSYERSGRATRVDMSSNKKGGKKK